ncbi:MAG: hypothetical protein P1U58_19685 [Verrucomicrobiales bacterium]|nr:hypothetical protein [Verrucomicrobiales bacterium]
MGKRLHESIPGPRKNVTLVTYAMKVSDNTIQVDLKAGLQEASVP